MLIIVSCGVTVYSGRFFSEKPCFKLDSFPHSLEDSCLIDTNGVYIGRPDYGNQNVFVILKFFEDESFVEISKFGQINLKQSDFMLDSLSVHRGRYRCEGRKLIVELFYPQQPPINKWLRHLKYGEIRGDTIEIFEIGPPRLFYITSSRRFLSDPSSIPCNRLINITHSNPPGSLFIKSKEYKFSNGQLLSLPRGVE